MAEESERVKSEAGKAMHSSDRVKRSLAGEVLRQAEKKRKRKRSSGKRASGKR
jgi:hypothetical protein